MNRKLLIMATQNKHKIEELKALFEEENIDSLFDIKSLKDFMITNDVIEDGTTLEENSLIKAKCYKELLEEKGVRDFIIVSDDTGLFVNSLNSEPGIYSARYSQIDNDNEHSKEIHSKEIHSKEIHSKEIHSKEILSKDIHSKEILSKEELDRANRIKLLNKLKNKNDREAYFETVICCIDTINMNQFDNIHSDKIQFFHGITKGRILETEVGASGFGYDSIFYSYEVNKSFGEINIVEKGKVSHRGKAMRCFVKKIKELYI